MTGKFRNVITERQGLTFDSRAEADDWTMLTLRERAGEISRLQRQVPFELQPAFRDRDGKRHRSIVYVADFTYVENGVLTAHEVKGKWTAVALLKAKLFQAAYPDVRFLVSKVGSNRRGRR